MWATSLAYPAYEISSGRSRRGTLGTAEVNVQLPTLFSAVGAEKWNVYSVRGGSVRGRVVRRKSVDIP
jgi:hypothetical protein